MSEDGLLGEELLRVLKQNLDAFGKDHANGKFICRQKLLA